MTCCPLRVLDHWRLSHHNCGATSRNVHRSSWRCRSTWAVQSFVRAGFYDVPFSHQRLLGRHCTMTEIKKADPQEG